MIEMDTAVVVAMIKADVEDRSPNIFLVHEIKRLLGEMREFKVENIRREQNLVSDALANLG